MITQAPFVFDRDYQNLGQVAHLWDEYMEVFERVKIGQNAYNDSFTGQLRQLAGADERSESAAIYLLQCLRHQLDSFERRGTDYASGLDRLRRLDGGGMRRFSRAVVHGQNGSRHEYESARVFAESSGALTAVMPKGKRSYGFSIGIYDTVLVPTDEIEAAQ